MVFKRTTTNRGFTLIELMVTVTIVGLLASIAISSFGNMTLRAKSAERATIMVAIAHSIGSTLQNGQQIPNVNGTSPATWTGVWNPPGASSVSKRMMNWALPGWSNLSMIVDGACYYSYFFHVTETSLAVLGQGDLDGDGVPSLVSQTYPVVGYAIQSPVEIIAGGEF